MTQKKGFSKSLDTVRLPDPLNRLCKIKFTGAINGRKAALAAQEAQQVKQMVDYSGMVWSHPGRVAGSAGWIAAATEGGRTRARVSAGAHINRSYSRVSACW